ncbi:MAG: polysaccharide biosynthesis C-terminal domain-containing protein [Chitinophagaceae bacterium]
MNICFIGMQFNNALKYSITLKSINILILFFINMLFVRIAGANVTGDFFYLITILSFITLIVSCSLESGITFYASKNSNHIISYAWLIIVFSILQILLSFLIISVAVKNSAALASVYLLIFVISNILISNFTALYISRKWFIAVNTIILIVNLITLLLLGLMFLQYRISANAEKIYIISFFVQATGLMIFFFIKGKAGSWKFPSPYIIKQIFKYSFLALIGNISFFLVTRLDYVFVKSFCSSGDLGNYVQVSKIGQMFVLMPGMAASVIFPFTVIADENILFKLQWLCRFMTMLMLLASIFIIITGKWLFPWLFGKEFIYMYKAMLFYLPGIFALAITSLLASHISGKGFISINVIASVIALIIVITGDIIFIPKYGINAAAAISSIAYLSCMVFLLRHFITKYKVKPSDFFRIGFTEFKYIFLYIMNKTKAV